MATAIQREDRASALAPAAALLAVCERKPQAVWNHPQWWVDRVRKDHPEAWQTILQANNSRPPLTLRVNTRQTKRADYLLALQAAGVEAAPVGAQGILLAGAGAVTASGSRGTGRGSGGAGGISRASVALMAGAAALAWLGRFLILGWPTAGAGFSSSATASRCTRPRAASGMGGGA